MHDTASVDVRGCVFTDVGGRGFTTTLEHTGAKQDAANIARDSDLDLGCAPYVLYGVKYIDPVSLAPFPGRGGLRVPRLRGCLHVRIHHLWPTMCSCTHTPPLAHDVFMYAYTTFGPRCLEWSSLPCPFLCMRCFQFHLCSSIQMSMATGGVMWHAVEQAAAVLRVCYWPVTRNL